jgi:hypothetical protein
MLDHSFVAAPRTYGERQSNGDRAAEHRAMQDEGHDKQRQRECQHFERSDQSQSAGHQRSRCKAHDIDGARGCAVHGATRVR